jgi:hypothetical protein
VDRLVLKTMGDDSPQAQISGGAAAGCSQRVEDNAFHPGTGAHHPWSPSLVDRLVLKTMGDDSPQAQISGGAAAVF